MMSAATSGRAATDESKRMAWASGLSLFAAVMLFLQGVFQLLEGIVLLVDDELFVSKNGYAFEFNTTVWGWGQIILGVLVILVGVAILSEATLGFLLGIVVVGLSALVNFAFIPIYPAWALTIIAMDVAVIWALCVMMSRDRVTD